MGQSGALRHLAGSGARYLDVQAVEDNLLARLADPVLLGYLASEGLDVAAKVGAGAARWWCCCWGLGCLLCDVCERLRMMMPRGAVSGTSGEVGAQRGAWCT
jgi:hypothetical protein